MAEDILLSLAATDRVDGIFHCCIIAVHIDDSVRYLARYFEFGAFDGYFCHIATSKLKQFLGCDDILPYLVYTSQDITLEKERNLKKYTSRRRGKIL